MDWLIFVAIVLGALVGCPAGWVLAGWIIKRNADRAAIERRLANWAG